MFQKVMKKCGGGWASTLAHTRLATLAYKFAAVRRASVYSRFRAARMSGGV